ncbi:MAG: tRNA(adenine34) deaminase [Bradymonadia bacterium]|jgi:tRNA(adenine34) deaminase
MDCDIGFMDEALREAKLAEDAGDVPVGAIIVFDGEIVGRGHNRRVVNNDPLAHAEVEALRDAAAVLQNWRLDGASMYVTLEPCPMCAGALVQARMGRLVYGTADIRGGGVRSFYQICDDRRANHRIDVVAGVRAEACANMLSSFFERVRA